MKFTATTTAPAVAGTLLPLSVTAEVDFSPVAIAARAFAVAVGGTPYESEIGLQGRAFIIR